MQVLCEQIWKNWPTLCKTPKFHNFQPIITWRHQEPLTSSWFIGTLAFLLKKSNVRKCSYLHTWNGGTPTWGIKRLIFDCMWHSWLPHPNWKGQLAKFTASVVQWLKNSFNITSTSASPHWNLTTTWCCINIYWQNHTTIHIYFVMFYSQENRVKPPHPPKAGEEKKDSHQSHSQQPSPQPSPVDKET